MKLLVTGAGGTLGRALTAQAMAAGHTVVAWDRHAAPPLQTDCHADWIATVAPDAILHLATASEPTGADNEGWAVNVLWSKVLTSIACARGLPLVFTSTALVFDNSISGPFTLASPSNATEGYGLEKRTAEHAVLLGHPQGARVVRLGWQMDPLPQGNNMVAHAQREQLAQGHVNASNRWLPACSFLEDTAVALLAALQAPAGLYMLDSNDGYSYAQILRALSARYQLGWTVVDNQDYVYDQRLLDIRLPLPRLSARLSTIGAVY